MLSWKKRKYLSNRRDLHASNKVKGAKLATIMWKVLHYMNLCYIVLTNDLLTQKILDGTKVDVLIVFNEVISTITL
jgi:hypothetical protein